MALALVLLQAGAPGSAGVPVPEMVQVPGGTFMMGYPKEPMEHMKVRTRKMGLSDKVFIKY